MVQRNTTTQNLPPSPPSLPLIGHLHLLKDPVHRTLQKISQTYGPVVSLRFGVRLVVLITSPSAVKECFTKNDIIFANRPLLLMGKHLGYNFNTMITAPYGEHWRNLRKISLLELLSTTRLNLSVRIRREEIKQMIGSLYGSLSVGYAKVELRSVFRVLVFNIMMRMIAGKRYYGGGGAVVGGEAGVVDGGAGVVLFSDVIREVLELAGASNAADFLPVLRWIDYGGYIKKIKLLAKKTDAFLQGLIDECRTRKGVLNKEDDEEEEEETMIDRLLLLQESDPEYYTDETIKGLILVSSYSFWLKIVPIFVIAKSLISPSKNNCLSVVTRLPYSLSPKTVAPSKNNCLSVVTRLPYSLSPKTVVCQLSLDWQLSPYSLSPKTVACSCHWTA
ncbi:hypothetical protein SOVF_133840 [Spinacia oleracea]|nr:hypothetical protein SOVF_133840 [Spinacia oleracea]